MTKKDLKNPKAKKEVFHKTTVDEARTAIHAEIEGVVDNPQRIDVDLDFKAYTYMDAKHPVGSEILRNQNRKADSMIWEKELLIKKKNFVN